MDTVGSSLYVWSAKISFDCLLLSESDFRAAEEKIATAAVKE